MLRSFKRNLNNSDHSKYYNHHDKYHMDKTIMIHF